MSTKSNQQHAPRDPRPKIAFFGYPDVFEDFYPHYEVTQKDFATDWACTGNHAFVSILQNRIGDVTWYEHSIKPEVPPSTHETIGCAIKFYSSSLPHRLLWRLFYLPKCAWRWRGLYRVYATIASYLSPLSLSFLRAIRNDRPDYIFVQDYCSGRFDVLILIARWLKIPLFAYHAGSNPDSYLGKWIRKFTLPITDKLLTSNQAETQKLKRLFSVQPEHLEVILTPIDNNIFHPINRTEACATLSLNPQRRYLLYIGRLLDPIKRISSILKAFSQLADQYDDVDLLIVGVGPDEDALKQQASSLPNDRVRFLGWVSEDAQKSALYNVSECLLLPSMREGFPTAVGEALSCGTPVLGSKLDGIVELITSGVNGWLIEPGDEKELFTALHATLDTPQKTRSMRKEALNTAVARVSPDTIASQLEDCFFGTGQATTRQAVHRSMNSFV